jgi:membrane-associated phospholipid phosphatase
LGSFDTRLYLDVNRFAARTAWLHGVVRAYAGVAGIAVLCLLLLVAWWRARDSFGGGGTANVADVLWAGIGAAVAVGIALPVSHLVGRARPYAAVHQTVEVLVARSGGFGMPSARAALAGGVIAGVLLARQRVVGVLAVIAGLLLAAAEVYVGVSYPGDVAAGLLLGAVVVVVARPLVISLLRSLTAWAAGVKGLRFVVGASAPVQFRSSGSVLGGSRPGDGVVGSGSAAASAGRSRPAASASASVRILESGAALVPHVPDGASRPVARGVAPAQTHVQPTPGSPAPAAAASGVRDAQDSGRRGAAGSAGDL